PLTARMYALSLHDALPISTGAAEVDAHEVGLTILDPLKDLDEVAYMRFASVYRNFSSLEDFDAAIQSLRRHRDAAVAAGGEGGEDRKSTRLNSSHVSISYA